MILPALALVWLCATTAWSQNGVLKSNISHDTVSLQELLKVTFQLENIQGKIEPPDFIGFQLVSGPNIKTQMQVIQGNMSQSYAVSYLLKPLEEGTFVIERAHAVLEDGSYLESKPMIITVSADRSVKKPNADGMDDAKLDFIFENPWFREVPPPAPRDSIQEKLKKLPRKKF